jgi:hypothetical protein
MARGTTAVPGDSEAIFAIDDATRAGMHLLIQLFGPSQCGKTLTGLYLARGIANALAGPKGVVGAMDTEGRARMFSDKIPGGFKVGELTRPFGPSRYLEGIELFISYGVDALMIDSWSHVWEGIGGVLDQAEQNEANGRKGLAKWAKPKRDYNRMVSILLTTRIPLIFCSRAKQPIKIETRWKNGREVEEWTPLPWEPIQDKRLKYDMTIVVPMTSHGSYETDPDRLKCPDDLRHLFTGEPLTIETGELIGRWVAGGEPVNHAHEALRKHAYDEAAKGWAALKLFYEGLAEPERLVLRPIAANLRSAARAADDEAEQQRQARDELEGDRAAPGGATAGPMGAGSMADPFGGDPFAGNGTNGGGAHDQQSGAARGFADPFGYSDLREPDQRERGSLAVPIRKLPDGGPDWEETAADMRELIATLTDPADMAMNGRFKRDNRDVLDQMRDGDRDAWNSVELRLADRDRERREGGNG